MGRVDGRVRADAGGAHGVRFGMLVGRWETAVLGESGQDDQGVGRVDGRVRADMEGHTGFVWSVCLSGDGSRLFSGSVDKTIKVWDVSTGACVQTLEGHTHWVSSVCLSGDGSRLFSGS